MNKYLEEFNLTEEQYKLLDEYYNLLIEKNKVINLTRVTDYEEVYIKHYFDSMLLYRCLDSFNNLIDVGSGAGFPGMVLGICRPNDHITLLEPTTKRANFLRDTISFLGLKNVDVINERAENLKDKKYKFATARAVAQLNILLELVIPLLQVGGKFFCLKGSNYQEELDNSKNAIKELNIKVENIYEFNLPNDLGTRAIIVFEKIKPTKHIYPRRYANILKKPL